MGQPEFVFRGHQAAVNSVSFFADDRFLVSGDQDGHLIVWNMLLKRQLVTATAAHSAAILKACGVSGDTVLSQGRDNKLNIWKLVASEFSGSLELVRSIGADSMSFCKFSHCKVGGTTWVVALENAGSGKAYMYNIDGSQHLSFSIERKSQTKAGEREDSPMCMKLVSQGTDRFLLLIGYESTMLQCFEILMDSAISCTSNCISAVATAHKEPVMSIDYDHQRKLVFTCAADNMVCCYSIEATGLYEVIPPAVLRNPGGSEVRCFLSPQLVVVAGWDYSIHIFRERMEHICSLQFHRAAITSVDVSTLSQACADVITDDMIRRRWCSRPQWLVAASRDSRISLWNIGSIA
ncbi:WD40-repeat-containing domain protein [Kickxella alabastrina]|uniref:WD40-repeat-containing domain protein n=1 Tax=Kickxella alabastrina TaxID=61397 RepID=UPI00221F4707|nr:WD40-repeat-containing domain protein [Kickxella alabastrina]KAI7829198.1 WD40-repeat-containing domain protein [Kickxella alabastrina]